MQPQSPGSFPMQRQLMNLLEPAIRTEILEAIPMIGRTIRHSAMIGALVGMGHDPMTAYILTEQAVRAGVIPQFGPESRILQAQLGPASIGTVTGPLGGRAGIPGALW